MKTNMKLIAYALAIPAYLVLVHFTSGRLLIGYGQGVWTTEYLVPALVGLALAVVAFRTTVEARPAKAAKAIAVGTNLLLFAGLTAATISLWGEFL